MPSSNSFACPPKASLSLRPLWEPKVLNNTIVPTFTHFSKQNVLVNENFVQLLESTCEEHPGLDVQYGGVGGFIAKKPPKRVDPMKVIQVSHKVT